jgi:NAD(P)-dependent dehydrogenase (short-subunit alcohol dehydrogenase family)
MKSVVLITGGGTGIGSALAKLLSSKYQVKVLIVGRTLITLKQTAGYNNNIEYINADITNKKEINKIFNRILNKKYKIKYLVNNAAIQNLSLLENVTNNMFENSFNTNVKAPLVLVARMLKKNIFEENARVLMIDSSSRYNVQKGMGLYAMTKSALFTLHKVMRKEYSGRLLVNSIYPGMIAGTNTSKNMKETNIPEIIELQKNLKQYLHNNKQIRILSPEESAEFIAWVLCDTDDYQFAFPEKMFIQNSKPISIDEWDIRDSECYIGCKLIAGTKQRQLAIFMGG